MTRKRAEERLPIPDLGAMVVADDDNPFISEALLNGGNGSGAPDADPLLVIHPEPAPSRRPSRVQRRLTAVTSPPPAPEMKPPQRLPSQAIIQTVSLVGAGVIVGAAITLFTLSPGDSPPQATVRTPGSSAPLLTANSLAARSLVRYAQAPWTDVANSGMLAAAVPSVAPNPALAATAPAQAESPANARPAVPAAPAPAASALAAPVASAPAAPTAPAAAVPGVAEPAPPFSESWAMVAEAKPALGETPPTVAGPKPDPAETSAEQRDATATRPVAAVASNTPTNPPRATSAAVAAPTSDRQAVDGLLDVYRESYTRRDASMLAGVWRGAEMETLSRAFAALQKQELKFYRCKVSMEDARATASCLGRLVYVPRVGAPYPRERGLTWAFEFSRDSGRWVIDQVKIQ